MARASGATAGDALRAKIARGGPYVHLEGGPYDGANNTAADWQVMREAERWGIEEAGEQRPVVLGMYRETKKFYGASTDHPKIPGLTATVWRWTGSTEMNQAGRRAR